MSQADGIDTSAQPARSTNRTKKTRSHFTSGDFCTFVAEGRDGVRVARLDDLCKKFGVQKKTLQKWLRTLKNQGRIEAKESGDGIHTLTWLGLRPPRASAKGRTAPRPALRLVSGTGLNGLSVGPSASPSPKPRTPKKSSNDNGFGAPVPAPTKSSTEDVATVPAVSQRPTGETAPRTEAGLGNVLAPTPELYTAPLVPKIPLTMPSAVTNDGRVNLSPLVGNAVIALICALGAAAFVWLGIHALDVTLRINGWFAASIAGTEETRPLFATAFNVIGYLAAGGPIAAHVLFTLRLRSAGWLATGFAIIFAAFGIFAASGFVATNTDASSEERRVMHARLSSADADIKRAREAIDKAGVLPDEATVSKDLASSVKAIRGGERACDAKKLSKTVERLCERVKDLRDDLRRISTDVEARRLLASATEDRKDAEAEAKAKNLTIGSEVNPMAAKLATVMPMTPETIGLVAFFFEAWGPELAVLVCFWFAGLLAVSAATKLFSVRNP